MRIAVLKNNLTTVHRATVLRLQPKTSRHRTYLLTRMEVQSLQFPSYPGFQVPSKVNFLNYHLHNHYLR